MNLEARTAIEALRAGVPNHAAVRLMGTDEPALEHTFDEQISRSCQDRPVSGPALNSLAASAPANRISWLPRHAVGADAELLCRQPGGG